MPGGRGEDEERQPTPLLAQAINQLEESVRPSPCFRHAAHPFFLRLRPRPRISLLISAEDLRGGRAARATLPASTQRFTHPGALHTVRLVPFTQEQTSPSQYGGTEQGLSSVQPQ